MEQYRFTDTNFTDDMQLDDMRKRLREMKEERKKAETTTQQMNIHLSSLKREKNANWSTINKTKQLTTKKLKHFDNYLTIQTKEKIIHILIQQYKYNLTMKFISDTSEIEITQTIEQLAGSYYKDNTNINSGSDIPEQQIQFIGINLGKSEIHSTRMKKCQFRTHQPKHQKQTFETTKKTFNINSSGFNSKLRYNNYGTNYNNGFHKKGKNTNK
jgi:hypothetical protein